MSLSLIDLQLVGRKIRRNRGYGNCDVIGDTVTQGQGQIEVPTTFIQPVILNGYLMFIPISRGIGIGVGSNRIELTVVLYALKREPREVLRYDECQKISKMPR